jgi:hypothetical protein
MAIQSQLFGLILLTINFLYSRATEDPSPYLLYPNENFEFLSTFHPMISIPGLNDEHAFKKVEHDVFRKLLFLSAKDFIMIIRTNDLTTFSIEIKNISLSSFSLIFGTETMVLLGGTI